MRGSVICGPQWLATPAVLADVQMQGAMHESGVPPGLGQTTPPKVWATSDSASGSPGPVYWKTGFPGRNCSQ